MFVGFFFLLLFYSKLRVILCKLVTGLLHLLTGELPLASEPPSDLPWAPYTVGLRDTVDLVSNKNCIFYQECPSACYTLCYK